MIDETRVKAIWAGELSEYDQGRDTAGYSCKDSHPHVLPHDRDPWPLSVKAVVATFGYYSSHDYLPKVVAPPKGALANETTSSGKYCVRCDLPMTNVAKHRT